MEALKSGVDNIYGGLETANGYLAIIAGQKESEETGEESKDSTPEGMSREEQEHWANRLKPGPSGKPGMSREEQERQANEAFLDQRRKEEAAARRKEWVDGVVQKIKDGGSATIEKALEFGP